MLEKKNPQKNLERKRWTFLLFGLALSIGISLAAINWESTERKVQIWEPSTIGQEDDFVIPITRPKPKPLPPPPPPPPVELIIVDNKIELHDYFTPLDVEFDDSDTLFDVDDPIDPNDLDDLDVVVPFVMVDNLPIFPGCETVPKEERLSCFQQRVMMDIVQKFKYPPMAIEMNIEEKIYVTFEIDKNGKVTNAQVAIGNDPYLKAEALRLVRSIPKMKPASQWGKPVAVRYTVPIVFSLD